MHLAYSYHQEGTRQIEINVPRCRIYCLKVQVGGSCAYMYDMMTFQFRAFTILLLWYGGNGSHLMQCLQSPLLSSHDTSSIPPHRTHARVQDAYLSSLQVTAALVAFVKKPCLRDGSGATCSLEYTDCAAYPLDRY